MKTIAIFPNIEKSESAGVLERIVAFFADKDVRLVLKSGNFGQPDFFERAIRIAKGE